MHGAEVVDLDHWQVPGRASFEQCFVIDLLGVHRVLPKQPTRIWIDVERHLILRTRVTTVWNEDLRARLIAEAERDKSRLPPNDEHGANLDRAIELFREPPRDYSSEQTTTYYPFVDCAISPETFEFTPPAS